MKKTIQISARLYRLDEKKGLLRNDEVKSAGSDPV